jgi:AraC-like DNA-binding protein
MTTAEAAVLPGTGCIALQRSAAPRGKRIIRRLFPLGLRVLCNGCCTMHRVRPHPTRKVCLFSGWQQLSVSLGYPVEEILAKASLPLELARQEHVEMTREQFFRFWRVMLADKSPRELADWFLALVDAAMPAPYLAALCSRNLRSGFERLAEYKPIIAPLRMSLGPCRGGEWVMLDWGVDDVPFSLALVELCALRNLAEKGIGRRVVPLRAQIPGAEGFPDTIAREILGVPVEPGPTIQVAFAKADLYTAFNTSNPVTLKILEENLQQRLSTVSERWSERLKFTLKRLLSDQRIRIEDAAEALSCSPRLLQRQLLAEGTNFKAVLDETRRELAMFYLGRLRFSPKETSFMLGYSEPATFYRAFRRWSDQSPSAYANSPEALQQTAA